MSTYTPSPDEVSFSVDVYALTRAWLADPALRREVERAREDGPATSMTEKLGYSNRAAQGEAPRWATLFPATQKGKLPGDDGLFWISKASQKPGEAPRPILRLRPQTPRPDGAQAARVKADSPAKAFDSYGGGRGREPNTIVSARRIEAKLSQGGADQAYEDLAKAFGIPAEELRRMAASAQLHTEADDGTDEDLRAAMVW